MSVYGTDTLLSTFRSFSRQCSHSEFSRLAPGYLTPLRLLCHGFAYDTPYGIRPTYSAVGSPDLLRPSITPARWYRNINLSSIDYAFRPRLRSRLTQSGRTFLWKPWVFGAWDSHPRSATHTGILSSMISTRPFGRTSPFMERSPTIPWDP